VFLAALDASKAFDRVNHFSLFIALMRNGIALPYLRVIIFWHLHLSAFVRWGVYSSNVIKIKVVLGRVASFRWAFLIVLIMT
jgi:hypothetical protein